MEPPDPQVPDEEAEPEIPPPLRVPEEYPGQAPGPDRRRATPEEPDLPGQPRF